MNLTKRHLAALALVACLAAGCGGGKPGTSSSAEHAASTQWAGGIRQWGHGMRQAIDGISVLFSHPAAVRGIQAGERRVGLQLRQYERMLGGCSARVRRLGAPPESF